MPETIKFTPALLKTHCVIDARAPMEYAEDHLPGAVNVPLLNDEERAEIGTIHKHEGPAAARIRGLELTCARFAGMVRTVADLAAERPVLVYCWRGGLRSRSLASLLEMAGVRNVFRLDGGYKAFRHHVLAYFEEFKAPAPLFVIHGMTGSGKTTFINSLDRNAWNVIDLEGIARHRGSAFGSIGMDEQPSQKHFDTLLWHEFSNARPDRPVVIEGESQRIGRILLPGNLYDVMAGSFKVWCRVSMDTRAARLSEEYGTPEFLEGIRLSLDKIRKKLGGECYCQMLGHLESGNLDALARGLMENYYDRLYYRYRNWEPEGEISLECFESGAAQLKSLAESQ